MKSLKNSNFKNLTWRGYLKAFRMIYLEPPLLYVVSFIVVPFILVLLLMHGITSRGAAGSILHLYYIAFGVPALLVLILGLVRDILVEIRDSADPKAEIDKAIADVEEML